MPDSPLIFLSYASPDREVVLDWHTWLSNQGFDVWMDKRRLKGGQNWDFEIKRAIQKAAIIVVFLSANSVDRRGYAQREIKVALDQRYDKLVDDIYIIPVMLDSDTPIPSEIASIQTIRPEDGNQFEAAAEAIRTQLNRLGDESAKVQIESALRWHTTTHRDQWDGLPGYDCNYQIIRLSSETYPNVGDISQVIQGWIADEVLQQRLVKFTQSTDICNFGQSKHRRQNSWDATCAEPRIKERVLTVPYTVWWYGAGAMHPNSYFRTFSFTLDPVTPIKSLLEIFRDDKAAFLLIQKTSREQLLSLSFGEATADGEPLTLLEDYVHSGTEKWEDFGNFVFGEHGIEFLFAPYQVSAYAFGAHQTVVSYEHLAKMMHEHYACALGIDYLRSY